MFNREKIGKLYIERNNSLGLTFQCIEVCGKKYRFGCPSTVTGVESIKQEDTYIYKIKLVVQQKYYIEERLDLKDAFKQRGIPLKELRNIKGLSLKSSENPCNP